MHCASCANIITRKVSKLPGVSAIDVNVATERATLEFDPAQVSVETINDAIAPLGYHFGTHAMGGEGGTDHREHTGVGQSKTDKLVELQQMKEKMQFVLPLALLIFFIMLWDIADGLFARVPVVPLPMSVFNTVTMVIATIVLFWTGQPFLRGVVTFLRHRVANMNTLIGIGTLTAYVYSAVIILFPQVRAYFLLPEFTYFDVTIVVIGFVVLGKYLETRSKIKTGDAIEKLLSLQAKTALVVRDGQEVEVPIENVLQGDILVVKPGGKIPVDGIIVEGAPFIDEAMVTGEPIPVEKNPGDGVVAGTINTTSAFTFKATKVGAETLLSSIIKMVEQAQGTKAPVQALADKISGVFVPVVMAIAFVAFISWLVFGTGVFGFSQALSYGLTSFVGILIIACPCALGLATPTAIIVGVGKGASEGILVKDAATLQKLHNVTTLVVDKTGTITKGKPELVSITPLADISEKEIASLLGTLESRSEHPIAHAIVSYVKEKGISIGSFEKFEILKGKGLKGVIGGVEYFAGNVLLVSDLSLPFEKEHIEKETKQGKTPIILATKEKVLGVVMVADAVKQEAKEAVERLHALGIKIIMVTGDDKNTARYIADQVGIDEVIAEVLPQDKLVKIQEVQKKGEIVAMAGDGVNDAPALAQADVGIAMATGTDVAIESAGITLLHGDISKLVKAVRLSKLTMRGIKQNLFWAFIYNMVGIPLAAGAFYPLFGLLLNPVFAGAAMAMSSVSVVLNSLRIKSVKL